MINNDVQYKDTNATLRQLFSKMYPTLNNLKGPIIDEYIDYNPSAIDEDKKFIEKTLIAAPVLLTK